MEIENVLITSHALERFKERYQALNRVSLQDSELLDKLHTLIINAKPEEEGPALQKRHDAHDGIGEYLVNPPWRFIFSDKWLVTCEVVPEYVSVVKNPYVPQALCKSRFNIRIEENQRKNVTYLFRGSDNANLYLLELAEINAVIRSLRAIGVQVNYRRTGSEKHKAASLRIVVPKTLPPYEIEQILNAKKVRIILGRNETFPLGLKKIICVGIIREDLEKILRFLHIIKINKD